METKYVSSPLEIVCHFTDENECKSGSHNCHKDATCRNKEGSFVCKCKDGFLGSGTQCQGKIFNHYSYFIY